jgi:hypothetical protein
LFSIQACSKSLEMVPSETLNPHSGYKREWYHFPLDTSRVSLPWKWNSVWQSSQKSPMYGPRGERIDSPLALTNVRLPPMHDAKQIWSHNHASGAWELLHIPCNPGWWSHSTGSLSKQTVHSFYSRSGGLRNLHESHCKVLELLYSISSLVDLSPIVTTERPGLLKLWWVVTSCPHSTAI